MCKHMYLSVYMFLVLFLWLFFIFLLLFFICFALLEFGFILFLFFRCLLSNEKERAWIWVGGEADKIWQELGRGSHNQNILHEKNKEKKR